MKIPSLWEIPLRLSTLYEQYGYDRYRMGKFEPYDFYMANKQFLKGEGVITFTDSAGRLMALKPDVTMSIVKNVTEDGGPRKFYYNESVFRSERGDYREINQMGLEYIGGGADWAQAEVVSLAIDTLDALGPEFSLDIGHMGFLSAMIASTGADAEASDELLGLIRQKNSGGIQAAAEKYALSKESLDALLKIAALRGELGAVLPDAESLVVCPEMDAALDELGALNDALTVLGKTVNLDFSVINDIDYYNGLVFRGYVRGAPRSVLAGGRYDGLLRRFGKDMTAVGFALYLSSLDRAFYTQGDYDVDVLLIYGDANPSEVAAAVLKLSTQGYTVRAEQSPSAEIRARKTLCLEADGSMSDA